MNPLPKRGFIELLPWFITLIALAGASFVAVPLFRRNAALEKEIASLNTQFKVTQETSARLASKNAEAAALKSEEGGYEKRYLRVLAENELLQKDFDALRVESDKTAKERNAFRDNIAALRKTFTERARLVSHLQKAVGTLSEKLKKSNSRLTALEAEKKSLNEALQESENNLKSAKVSAEKTKTIQNPDMLKGSEILKTQMREAQRKIGELEAKLKEDGEKIEKLEALNKNLNDTKALWKKEQKSLREELNLAQSKNAVGEASNKIKKLTVENGKLREALSRSQRKSVEKEPVQAKVEYAPDSEKAITSLRNANQKTEVLVRDSHAAHYNSGILYTRLGEYPSAIAEFKTALVLDPNDAATHYNMAVIYDSYLRDYKAASKHYETYVRLLPKAADAGSIQERLFQLQIQREVNAGQDLRKQFQK